MFKSTDLLAYGLMALTLLASVAGYVYDFRRNQAPDGVFWSAIQNSLSSSAVTCAVHKSANGQVGDRLVSLDLASKQKARVLTTLSQKGTTVTTDDISLPDVDYVRYTNISSGTTTVPSAKMAAVLNLWARQPREASSKQAAFGTAAMGGCIVPLADLSGIQAERLMGVARSRQVFRPDTAHSQWHFGFDEPYRTYQVMITPGAYVTFMKQVDAAYGTKVLTSVSPDAYQSKTAGKLTFWIGADSHRLQRIEYADKHESFTFSGYGVRPDTSAPASYISGEELQKKLDTL